LEYLIKISKRQLAHDSLMRLIFVLVASLGMYIWGYFGIIYGVSALFSFILLGVKSKRITAIEQKKCRQAGFINAVYKMIEYFCVVRDLREELKIGDQVVNLSKKILYVVILVIALPLVVFLVLRRRYSSDLAGAFIIILSCSAIWFSNYCEWRFVKEHYSHVDLSRKLILDSND
jgi:hypothetical protein